MLLLAAATVAALTISGVLRYRDGQSGLQVAEASSAPLPPDRPLRPLPTWVIPAGTVAVAVITWLAVWRLQGSVPAVGDQVERAKLRVESIRTGLTIGAGVTAAFALLLAFRRQQLAERTQQATEYDAGEKRVTELYVKAADQLGATKAPVRLAGLYALERLAQDNPAHRQSIVEVICAYLRMPYTPPDDQPTPEPDDQSPADGPAPAAGPTDVTGDSDKPAVDPREERQVRLAAQRILARHLRPTTPEKQPDPLYWGPKTTLDLPEAVLIDFDLRNCHLHNATFNKTHFTGTTQFVGATFSGDARFDGATFAEDANFGGATFKGDATFIEARFGGEAEFLNATFSGDAWFFRTGFNSKAEFFEAKFSGHQAWFFEATFSGKANFMHARFSGDAWFEGATFAKDAEFGRATFSGITRFVGARFSSDAQFDMATFSGTTSFGGATLDGKRYDGPVTE
ncbi:pentapeptide repeat-containing protein (plasmid) [Verrucosispora sp. NA02020]|nr:pentapeptide repeat-containing protein [Verrucosispora sp. NA02020]